MVLERTRNLIADASSFICNEPIYIARQQLEITRQQRLATRRIPAGLDYQAIPHLRAEAREKLVRVGPTDLAQAARISGITPADVSVLMIHLEGGRGNAER